LVNLFGGKIQVESDLGKGASFYFTATFDKDQQLAKQLVKEETYQHPIDIRGVRVLVVEDNEINVTILERFLQKWGIRIKEATNGVHALELLKFHKFDLILMDLEMPEMNGYDAVKIIRQTDTVIPIIAFTATLLDNMDTLITNDGFNDYILKPFRPADLKKKIEKFAPNRKIEYA
jgi:CheY-like chemotaxis protein